MKTTLDILMDAKALIDTEQKWNKRYLAKKNSCGVVAHPLEKSADCFCAIGALARAGHDDKLVEVADTQSYFYEIGSEHLAYDLVDETIQMTSAQRVADIVGEEGLRPNVLKARRLLAEAVIEVSGDYFDENARENVENGLGTTEIWQFNDNHSHADVMKAFSHAIEMAKETTA